MTVLHARDIEKAWADRSILRGVDLRVDAGERIGLVGPNGCGKSTLLQILAGLVEPDGGEVTVWGRRDLLAQEPRLEGTTVGDAVAVSLAWHRQLLADWQAALDDGDMDLAGTLQDRLDQVGWELDHRIDAVLDRLDAPPRDRSLVGLSGGEKRRVALARVLLAQPEVLLLDEPTNHLDAETIDWLQDQLTAWQGAVILVTHDRYLLEAVATRIVEIEDGEAVSYEGSYADYLVARAERRAQLHRAEEARLSLIEREAAWASRSPAARSTKQKARLERLEAAQSQRPLPKERAFHLDFSTGLKQGQTVLEAHGLTKRYGERTLFQGLDLSLLRGERLGIVGPNGAGKSTLLHVLSGRIQADRGSLQYSPRVVPAILDQHRTGLDDHDTVFENAGGGAERVTVGDRDVHVKGLLDRFLFPRAQHDALVSTLSGGERARLLLVRLMLQGANLLLLDEPTNDLDLMTLRVLEEALMSFDGSAVVVTHDRAFLDRVCTGVLAFEPDGVTRYASREQAMRAAKQRAQAEAEVRKAEAAKVKAAAPAPKRERTGLSFKEKRELEEVEGRIEALEAEIEALQARYEDPSTYEDAALVQETATALATAEEALEAAMSRWEALAERAG